MVNTAAENEKRALLIQDRIQASAGTAVLHV